MLKRLPAARRLVVQGSLFIVARGLALTQFHALIVVFKLSSGEVTLAINEPAERMAKKKREEAAKSCRQALVQNEFPAGTYASVVAQPRDVLLQPAELLGGGADDALEF